MELPIFGACKTNWNLCFFSLRREIVAETTNWIFVHCILTTFFTSSFGFVKKIHMNQLLWWWTEVSTLIISIISFASSNSFFTCMRRFALIKFTDDNPRNYPWIILPSSLNITGFESSFGWQVIISFHLNPVHVQVEYGNSPSLCNQWTKWKRGENWNSWTVIWWHRIINNEFCCSAKHSTWVVFSSKFNQLSSSFFSTLLIKSDEKLLQKQ